MRIAHVLRPAAGGMVTHVRDLIADPRVQGSVAAPAFTLEQLGLASTPTLTLSNGSYPHRQIVDALRLATWLRRHRIDLVHNHGVTRLPTAALAAKLARIPWITTFHNLSELQPSGPAALLVRTLARQAAARIAVSQAIRASLPFPDHDIRVVVNGIDTEPYDRLPEKSKARQRLGWNPDTPVVLAVARLSPEKGVDLLPELANPDRWKIVVAGDGPLRDSLAGRGLELLGQRSDIPMLMAAADVLVVPSRSEGLGLVALEAAAAARPVVAHRVGGLPEVVEDEKTGLLVDPNDTTGLKRAVQHLLDNPEIASTLGNTAARRVRSQFSRRQMWDSTWKCYQQASRP